MNRVTSILRWWSAAVVLAGCETAREAPTSIVTMTTDARDYVTGEAAAHLDRSGRFILGPPRPPADIPIISPERARELALAYLRTWGQSAAEVWSEQAGRRIEPGHLKLADRVYYADTPHGRIADGIHGAYQRMIGPWYLLLLMDGEEQVVGIAVSAYSTDLEVRDGIVHVPVESGEYFTSRVIDRGLPGPAGFPVAPEEAVQHIYAATGAKVSHVPELVLRNSAWSQFAAQWKLQLDRPIDIETILGPDNPAARDHRRAQEVFVGPGNTILIPNHDSGEAARLSVIPHGGGIKERTVVAVPRRPGMFVHYTEVQIIQEN
jgi:hypothetical protein